MSSKESLIKSLEEEIQQFVQNTQSEIQEKPIRKNFDKSISNPREGPNNRRLHYTRGNGGKVNQVDENWNTVKCPQTGTASRKARSAGEMPYRARLALVAINNSRTPKGWEVNREKSWSRRAW